MRSDVDRSEERDESGVVSRTRSLDSIDAEDEEDREIPTKKKKHRPLEESVGTGKKTDKLKRRQHVERASSEDDEQEEDKNKKRKRKLKKRQLSGGVIITKPRSPEEEERDWGEEDYDEGRSDLDWEERGELDYERQLNLEKRRQDLQRQLALMDEEEALREKAERKVKEPKKEKGEEQKPVIPVVHSKLHPEKSSVSPGDEFSPVSSQSTPKKKKKKNDGESKKVKTKHKVSPLEKELKKRKSMKPTADGLEPDTAEERTRKVSELSPEVSKLTAARIQQEMEVGGEDKLRGTKKKPLKTKVKEGHLSKSSEESRGISSEIPSRRPQQSSPVEEVPRDKKSYSPEEERAPFENVRRRTALSSPEGSDSPALYPRDDRNRMVTDSSDGSPRKPVRTVLAGGVPSAADYKMKAKGYDKRYREQESPSTPEHSRRTVVKEPRQAEEGRAERRKNIVDEQPPHSPSPEDIHQRGPVTPPEEHRRHRSPPRGDKRGPQTPPGEPEFDDDGPRHVANDRGLPRRRGPYTPPPPATPPVRSRVEKSREEFYEGRSDSVPYRDEMPRTKERGERETRYSKSRDEDRGDAVSRGGRGQPPIADDLPRNRGRDEELVRARNRDDRQDDYHQRGRPKDDRADDFHRVREREPERSDDHHRSRLEDPRGDEFSRRKPEGDDEYLRRRDERDDDHLRTRNREPEKEDERLRRREERHDEHQRGRVTEDEMQRSRARDVPRRQFESVEERHWEAPRGDRESREIPYAERDRRRPDMPRQDFPDNRGRERPVERPRDREGRHPPPGPDYHRRGASPPPHGQRRSPPPHGPPRGPPRFMERRRSLSPGGRREEGYRQGPPRDQAGYSTGRDSLPGRGGYSAPFDNRGRPMESRRRNSPPPRQYAERGRGAPRGRGGRVGRGFPDRMRPPGDRYQEPPRDRGAPWDPERRRDREHPRDRSRPHDESRDRERKPRGEVSPGRGPRHFEDKRGASPGRGSSPPRDRRTHDQEKIPRDVEEDRRRKSDDEDEWEYEEDMAEGKDRVPKHVERKRPREATSSVSTPESPVGGKRRRSETPETEEVTVHDVPEGVNKADEEAAAPDSTGTPAKQATKIKKKKVVKKEGKASKPDDEAGHEVQVPEGTELETEGQLEGEKQPKGEKKHKREKGKTKEKNSKKKKKSSTLSTEEHEMTRELKEEPAKLPEEVSSIQFENVEDVTQSTEGESNSKVAKKRRHADVPEEEEAKVKESDKPPKKKKKKKLQPEVVVQPWVDLEGDDEETDLGNTENTERQENDKDGKLAQNKPDDDLKSDEVTDIKQDTPKGDEPIAVFSDWSDDSPIGDDAWSDINELPEISDVKPTVEEKEREDVTSPAPNSVPAYDDVYDPISDDELDAMLGDEDEKGTVDRSVAAGLTSAPMPVEDVDWSALVSSQGASEKTGEEPGSHLKRFTPGHVFSRIGISSSLAGPRLTKLVLQTCAEATKDNPSGVETVDTSDTEGTSEPQVANTIGALMAGAAAKRREREDLFTNVGPCRRALCARKDLAMRKRLRRLTGKVGLFQTPPSAPVDNELYLMSVALYKHEEPPTDSSVTKLIPSRVGTVLATVTS